MTNSSDVRTPATAAPSRVVLLGPPGAGKGTQAALLAQRLGVPAISTGDIFRANKAAGTPLGREAQRYMDAGEYVPDELTNRMVADRLAEPDAATGFLLDGYPRTTAQVRTLDEVLAAHGTGLDAVLEITADVDIVVARLLKRASEQGRSDDTEDVVRRRLEVYAEQTAPLAAAYASRGLLVTVDGVGSVQDVQQRIVTALLSAGDGLGGAAAAGA
ncbi:Adenylate kinase [Quadrisphaera granulorum]|uniref:Adenylate kinase n=1 Tax=Quadrisphaera granulorum TaxID=317664 RepID=A0A316ACK0_9ACTN|nr:adenylate kinase [Quadrisphaera granulorum]PWJ55453.1 adenylate kinase [Quadrisphaera granulorum]SZE95517.1 Adenylate kinase [Quadrisphaera granulorum]